MTGSAEQNPSIPGSSRTGSAGRPEEVVDPLTPADAAREGRVGGLDAARALAIVGMVMVHFGPNSPPADDWLAWFYGLSHGRASLLFVVLAGIGMTLLAGHRDAAKWRRAWPRLFTRVAVLLPLGLGLQLLNISALVILQYYALFFLLAAPATLLRDRILLPLAAFVSVAGPVAYFLIDRTWPHWVIRYNPVSLDDQPLQILRELLFTGSYPAIVWMAPFLFGMWLGRRDLNAFGTRMGLLAGGAVTVAVTAWLGTVVPEGGWWRLADTEPHSQMILWLLNGTGAAAAVLAVCLILTDLLGRLMWPVVAMGQLALTIYVGHLLLLAAERERFTTEEVDAALVIVGTFTLGAILFAVVWRQCFSRGPLESLLNLPARLIERWG